MMSGFFRQYTFQYVMSCDVGCLASKYYCHIVSMLLSVSEMWSDSRTYAKKDAGFKATKFARLLNLAVSFSALAEV